MVYDHKMYQEDLMRLIREGLGWEEIKGKKILITGASGMIGTFLVDVFLKRNEIYHDAIRVFALSRNMKNLRERLKYHIGDPCLKLIEQDVSREFYLKGEPDFIIHAASNTHPKEYATDPVGTITTNVFGSYYLLEYAKMHRNCRIVLLSSVEIYGKNRGDVRYFDEDYCGYLNCNTLRAGYPESKRLSEALLQAYLAQYQVDGVLVRLSRVYGPTVAPDDSKAISQFIHKAVQGEDIVLKSEGKQLYSYTYVADAVQAVLQCMLKGERGGAYNVADPESDINLKDMAEYIACIVGRKVVFELPDDKEKSGYSTATMALLNSQKIRKLGWNARYPIREGLKRTLMILKDERISDTCNAETI